MDHVARLTFCESRDGLFYCNGLGRRLKDLFGLIHFMGTDVRGEFSSGDATRCFLTCLSSPVGAFFYCVILFCCCQYAVNSQAAFELA